MKLNTPAQSYTHSRKRKAMSQQINGRRQSDRVRETQMAAGMAVEETQSMYEERVATNHERRTVLLNFDPDDVEDMPGYAKTLFAKVKQLSTIKDTKLTKATLSEKMQDACEQFVHEYKNMDSERISEGTKLRHVRQKRAPDGRPLAKVKKSELQAIVEKYPEYDFAEVEMDARTAKAKTNKRKRAKAKARELERYPEYEKGLPKSFPKLEKEFRKEYKYAKLYKSQLIEAEITPNDISDSDDEASDMESVAEEAAPLDSDAEEVAESN